jgi:hypothetical protein
VRRVVYKEVRDLGCESARLRPSGGAHAGEELVDLGPQGIGLMVSSPAWSRTMCADWPLSPAALARLATFSLTTLVLWATVVT